MPVSANTAYQAQALLPSQPKLAIPTDYKDYVDYEVYVPLEHWATGNDAVNPDALPRVRQLEL